MTRALIAEDEPLLAAHLQSELQKLWPELDIIANLRDGQSALLQAMQQQPDVIFLDIHMPKMTGLEAAEILAEEWDEQKQPLPIIVFVTAFNAYAIEAFERAAFDYVLKPVQEDRLQKTVERLQKRIKERQTDDTAGLLQLPQVLAQTTTQSAEIVAAPKILQVTSGNTIHMVKVDDVLYFEAADKYLRVFTRDKDYVLRGSLREMQAMLPASDFWQIHRSVLVRATAIDKAVRQSNGKLIVSLRERPEQLQVSRLYAGLFKAS